MKASNVIIKLRVVLFKEDNVTIAFCPALDLVGYGETEAEAKKSFEIVLFEFIDYTKKKGTLEKELQRLGWTRKNKHTSKLMPPDFLESVKNNEELKKVVNNHPFKTYNKPVPTFA